MLVAYMHINVYIYIHIIIFSKKFTWMLVSAVIAVVSVNVVELPCCCISIRSAEMKANNNVSVCNPST